MRKGGRKTACSCCFSFKFCAEMVVCSTQSHPLLNKSSGWEPVTSRPQKMPLERKPALVGGLWVAEVPLEWV